MRDDLHAFDADVLVVGAGPAGLTLAAALAARRVSALTIDRQTAGSNTSRAAVVHARTLEVLEPLIDGRPRHPTWPSCRRCSTHAARRRAALANRLTQLATLPRGLRALRNAVLSTLATLPPWRRALAWRLSGLVFR